MRGGVRIETRVAEMGTVLRISGADSGSQWRVLGGVREVTGISALTLELESERMWESVENSVGPQKCNWGGAVLGTSCWEVIG